MIRDAYIRGLELVVVTHGNCKRQVGPHFYIGIRLLGLRTIPTTHLPTLLQIPRGFLFPTELVEHEGPV